MVTHKLTGEQRNKAKSNWLGHVSFVLEVEVEISGETFIEMGTNVERRMPSRLEWREAQLNDFVLPGHAPINDGSYSGFTALPDYLVRFLMGCGEINGKSFGEKHDVLPGSCWWRTEIRKYINDASILDAETSNGGDPTQP